MKKRILVFVLCILAVLILARHARAETVTWSLPSTYTDGSAITAAKQATVTTKLYKSLDHLTWGVPIATVLNGATAWTGNLNVAPGGTIYVTATATIPAENMESGYAPYYTYTVAYLAPSTPTSITITRP